MTIRCSICQELTIGFIYADRWYCQSHYPGGWKPTASGGRTWQPPDTSRCVRCFEPAVVTHAIGADIVGYCRACYRNVPGHRIPDYVPTEVPT